MSNYKRWDFRSNFKIEVTYTDESLEDFLTIYDIYNGSAGIIMIGVLGNGML